MSEIISTIFQLIIFYYCLAGAKASLKERYRTNAYTIALPMEIVKLTKHKEIGVSIAGSKSAFIKAWSLQQLEKIECLEEETLELSTTCTKYV